MKLSKLQAEYIRRTEAWYGITITNPERFAMRGGLTYDFIDVIAVERCKRVAEKLTLCCIHCGDSIEPNTACGCAMGDN